MEDQFDWLLNHHVGENSRIFYNDLIDLIIGLDGERMLAIKDLTLVQLAKTEPTVAIHSLNTMLIETMIGKLLEAGVEINEDNIAEEHLPLIGKIFKAVFSIEWWEMPHDLLAILNQDEGEYTEDGVEPSIITAKEKLFSIMEIIQPINEDDFNELVDDVADEFVEICQESLEYKIKMLMSKLNLTEDELLVYQINEKAKKILADTVRISVTNPLREYVSSRGDLNKFDVMQLTVHCRNSYEFINSILFIILATETLDNDSLHQRFMDVVINTGLGFREARNMALEAKKVIGELP